MASKILIVEDDPSVIRALETALKRERFEVVVVRDGVEALRAVLVERPDLVVLGLVLPRLGGIEVCRKIRTDFHTAATPIIVLGTKEEGVRALEAGADDYVARPFKIDELLARIKALQRRTVSATPARVRRADIRVRRAGIIEMDLDRRTVSVKGKAVALTAKEYELLRTLLEAKGRVLTRDGLVEKVWGHATALRLGTRTVDVHVGRLRRKLGPAGRYIITVRDAGYRVDIFPNWIYRDSS